MSDQLIPVFVCIITAVATLTAVFLTNYFNIKSLEKNLRYQSQLKNYEIKLNKLEDIYELFEKWETHFSTNYLNYLYFHNKKITESHFYESTKNSEFVFGVFQKMMALLNIHFPELVREYKKVNLARAEVVKYMRIDSNINTQDFIEAQENFESVAKEFKKQISLLAQRNQGIIS